MNYNISCLNDEDITGIISFKLLQTGGQCKGMQS